MKDYSLNLEDSKTFVLNYIVINNQIMVRFANGEGYFIPYNAENEVKLLKRMKTQVLQSDEFMNKQEKRFSRSWKWAILSASIIALDIISLASGNSAVPVLSGICASWFVFEIYNMVDSKRNIKDINKNKMLLNNEERLNEKVKENYNVLAYTDRETKEIVHSTPIDQPVFTLNSIDKIKYEELKRILDYLSFVNTKFI